MSVQVRTSPVRASAGLVTYPAANVAQEQISASQILDWTLRGWVFSASQGLEATDISGVTTEADTYAAASLQSPTADTAVVPLRVWVSVTNAGGGLLYTDIAYTKAAAQCATALTLSGTALNIQNHYTPNPQATAKATALKIVTPSALLTTDYITVAHHHWISGALTTGITVPDLDYKFKAPLVLTAGAALLVYFYDATTTDAKIMVSMTWAEIPTSIYIPE